MQFYQTLDAPIQLLLLRVRLMSRLIFSARDDCLSVYPSFAVCERVGLFSSHHRWPLGSSGRVGSYTNNYL